MDFFLQAWRITTELAPSLLVGVAVAGVLHALLPKGLLERSLSGRWGVVRASAIGVPLPLCSCAVIPLGIGLKRQGASEGAAVAFLISTPQTGIDSILVTAAMLGWPLTLFKVAAALVMGLVGGWATDAVTPRRLTLPVIDSPGNPRTIPSWKKVLLHADDLVRSIWRWLVLGVLISAGLSAWAPPDAFGAVAAYGGLASMGVALAVSLPLYVCATASVPIAAALVAGGLPLGAVLVFLMAGPATNAATVGAVFRGLGPRPLVVYLLTILLGSIAGGLLFEAILGGYSVPSFAQSAHTHEHTGWFSAACGAALLLLLARYAAQDLRAYAAGKKDDAA